jgi:hypothetical protein
MSNGKTLNESARELVKEAFDGINGCACEGCTGPDRKFFADKIVALVKEHTRARIRHSKRGRTK